MVLPTNNDRSFDERRPVSFKGLLILHTDIGDSDGESLVASIRPLPKMVSCLHA